MNPITEHTILTELLAEIDESNFEQCEAGNWEYLNQLIDEPGKYFGSFGDWLYLVATQHVDPPLSFRGEIIADNVEDLRSNDFHTLARKLMGWDEGTWRLFEKGSLTEVRTLLQAMVRGLEERTQQAAASRSASTTAA